MRPRAKVFKRDGQWWAQRPAYGFAPAAPQPFGTRDAACAWLAAAGAASAGPSVERTRTPAGVWKHNQRHDNWPMEVR